MQKIPFIDLFESALHVSGDKLTHLQEHFLTVFLLIYLNLLYMFRATNSPIFRSTFWLIHSQKVLYMFRATNSPIFRSTFWLYVQSKSTVKKCSWRWASLSPETCRADSNRSIKRSINGIFCILLVAYIDALMYLGEIQDIFRTLFQ